MLTMVEKMETDDIKNASWRRQSGRRTSTNIWKAWRQISYQNVYLKVEGLSTEIFVINVNRKE